MERLVYTRCSPSIDIVQEGKIISSEGYGVAAISKDFFANTKGVNYRMLNKMVCEDKGDVKILDKFFEYACVGDNLYFLSATGHLPLCNEARINGKTHRPIFMADALVGDFNVRPADLLLKENFPGDTVHQNQYYRLDTNEKPFVLDGVDANNLKKRAIDAGVNPKGCKILLAFLLKNLFLSPEKQESMIIADSNENVIKMLQVVEASLPVQLAKKITFLTHTTTMKNNVERYVYFTLQGMEIGDYNTVEEEIKRYRRVKYMVVGYSNFLARNDSSEYQMIQADGSSTYTGNIPTYVNDIIDRNPTAIKFLEYVETKLNGQLGQDVDNIYALYKSVSGIANENSYLGVLNIATQFYNSSFRNEEGFAALVKNVIGEKYQGFAIEDALNEFRMLSLIKNSDVNLSSRLLTLGYKEITKGFDVTPVDIKAVKAFRNLEAANYASNEVINDMVAKHISTKGLMSILNNDESLVLTYYKLYKKANIAIGIDEKLMIGKMIDTFLGSNGQMRNELIDLLNANAAIKDEILIKKINESVASGKTEMTEALFALYKPEVRKEDIKFEVARLAKNTVPFSKYEKEYADKVSSNSLKVEEIANDMFKMLEIYPESASDGMACLRFLQAYLDTFKASEQNAPLGKAVDLAIRILDFKKVNDMNTLKLIITKFESKSLMFALHNSNNRPDKAKLEKIGVSAYSKYLDMEAKVLRAANGKAQIEALQEFMNVRIDVKPDHLNLPSLNALIKSLKYQNAPVHAYFFECFQNFENTQGFIHAYLEILTSEKGFDKIALYHSLVLSTLVETTNDKTRKMLKALEAIINQEDSDLMKACYDKKYEKALEMYPLNTEQEKKAMEITKARYKSWDDNHKGFFAKLFGKK